MDVMSENLTTQLETTKCPALDRGVDSRVSRGQRLGTILLK